MNALSGWPTSRADRRALWSHGGCSGPRPRSPLGSASATTAPGSASTGRRPGFPAHQPPSYRAQFLGCSVVDERLAANHAMWEERVAIHERSAFYDVDSFRAGRRTVQPFEVEEVGPVDGLRLCHLQCHFGMDSITWARAGADVVGLDFSGEAVATATRLAAEVGMADRARFVRSVGLRRPHRARRRLRRRLRHLGRTDLAARRRALGRRRGLAPAPGRVPVPGRGPPLRRRAPPDRGSARPPPPARPLRRQHPDGVGRARHVRRPGGPDPQHPVVRVEPRARTDRHRGGRRRAPRGVAARATRARVADVAHDGAGRRRAVAPAGHHLPLSFSLRASKPGR